MNYIDIRKKLSWITDGIDIVIHSKIRDAGSQPIDGFPILDTWVLELIIYDAELEPNKLIE